MLSSLPIVQLLCLNGTKQKRVKRETFEGGCDVQGHVPWGERIAGPSLLRSVASKSPKKKKAGEKLTTRNLI